jgi:NADH-quinone oxidoreductase subunit E
MQKPHIDLAPLDALIENETGGNLISLLQKTQHIYGYLPREAVERIARAAGTSPANVQSVASFYAQFRFEPSGRNLIQLCKGTACHVNGAADIEAAISAELGISDGETTADGAFSLECVACIGCCSLSPVMTVNGEPHGRLTPESAVEILKGYK